MLRVTPTRRYFHALQNTFKILINSFYGYLGFAIAPSKPPRRVTQTGRDLLGQMIEWLKAQGARSSRSTPTASTSSPAVHGDAVGRPSRPPPRPPPPATGALPRPAGKMPASSTSPLRNRKSAGWSEELPPGIEVEFDEQFEAMFSYKAKNYALLTRDGEVVIKGGALKSRGLEKFQRVFLEEMIKLLMEGKPEAIPGLRDEFAQKIRDREWPIEMLMKTDTLQDSLEKYRQKIAAGGRNRAAVYELALTSGRNYKPGDQISYYVKATPKKVAAYEAAKLVTDFDPQNRDENIDYYVAKLDDLVKKFANITPAAADPKQASLGL